MFFYKKQGSCRSLWEGICKKSSAIFFSNLLRKPQILLRAKKLHTTLYIKNKLDSSGIRGCCHCELKNNSFEPWGCLLFICSPLECIWRMTFLYLVKELFCKMEKSEIKIYQTLEGKTSIEVFLEKDYLDT